MYKGRVGIWITVLVVCFAISFFATNIPKWFHTDNLTLSVHLEEDTVLADVMTNEKIDSFKFLANSTNGDIIITSFVTNELTGYNKIATLHSPLVLYFNSYVDEHSGGFVNVVKDAVYKIDLKTVLTAMSEDKEWSSLGMSDKVVSGTVRLCIPNESCGYYNDVVELFYITLNNGNVPTDAERTELKSKVDSLIAKCEKVTDINQSILNDCKEKKNSNRVYIGPEYLCVRNAGYYCARSNKNNSYYQSYYPVYMTNHTFLKANVFARITEDDSMNSVINDFKNVVIGDKDFFSSVGWRIENGTVDIRDVKSCLMSNPY